MTWSPETGSLDLTTLTAAYAAGTLTPNAVVDAIYDRIAARGDDHVWIHLVSREDALAAARTLKDRGYDGRTRCRVDTRPRGRSGAREISGGSGSRATWTSYCWALGRRRES